jgi:hypothetical protein
LSELKPPPIVIPPPSFSFFDQFSPLDIFSHVVASAPEICPSLRSLYSACLKPIFSRLSRDSTGGGWTLERLRSIANSVDIAGRHAM